MKKERKEHPITWEQIGVIVGAVILVLMALLIIYFFFSGIYDKHLETGIDTFFCEPKNYPSDHLTCYRKIIEEYNKKFQ